MKRKTKESEIAVGDKVLIKNVVFLHKLTTNFDVAEYEVKGTKVNVVEIIGNGKIFKRNVSHVEKIPTSTTSANTPQGHLTPSQKPLSTSTCPTNTATRVLAYLLESSPVSINVTS